MTNGITRCDFMNGIAIAGSDSGWDAYTHVAVDQAHRAVVELTT